MRAFTEFLQEYYAVKEKYGVRMGQHFINTLILCREESWPSLYNERDERVCERVIYNYMKDNQWLEHSLDSLKELCKNKSKELYGDKYL